MESGIRRLRLPLILILAVLGTMRAGLAATASFSPRPITRLPSPSISASSTAVAVTGSALRPFGGGSMDSQ